MKSVAIQGMLLLVNIFKSLHCRCLMHLVGTDAINILVHVWLVIAIFVALLLAML